MATNFGTTEARTFGELFGTTAIPRLFGEMGEALEAAENRWIEGGGRNRSFDSAGRTVSVIDGFGGFRQLEGSQ